MHFRIFHIFREENEVANVLANYGTSSSEFMWCDDVCASTFSFSAL